MAEVIGAGSFGSSFGMPAGSSIKCYGKAENRVLKRVGEKLYSMKKISFFITFFVARLLTFAQSGSVDQMTVNVTIVNDAKVSNLMLNSFNNLVANSQMVSFQTGIPSFSSSDFDFVNLYKSEKPGEKEIAYSVSYIGSNSNIKYAFTLTYNDGVFSKPMLVKANIDRSSISYFDLAENKSVTIEENNGNYYANVNDVDFGNQSQNRNSGCGQCVANCIADAYTNHGWASVWATLQSIFVPATGVGIAIGCTGRCCIPPTPNN